MLNEEDVYRAWRRAKGAPYRMPKDWEKKWNSFKPEEREYIRKMVRLLATTWQDINIDNYFSCGYEIWKGFYITQWFKPEVIQLYIQKSKNRKRIEENVKRSLTESAKFVLQYCKENCIKSLNVYARLRDDQKLLPLEHFVKDQISKWFLVFLIHKKYCFLTQADWDKIPFDQEKLREMKIELREQGDFTKKLEDKIGKILSEL